MTIELTHGSYKVIAVQSSGVYFARLYVNHGDTPTYLVRKLHTREELYSWARKVFAL